MESSAEATAEGLHPAEHRAYRELYASCRQLINRWERLVEALADTPYAAVLERGRGRIEQLLHALAPTTELYGLHGGIAAQGLGARIADVRGAVTDRSVDTGMVLRFAVLDVEHVATLLGHLGALARAREDDRLEAFCRQWESAIRPEVEATRLAAIDLRSARPGREAARRVRARPGRSWPRLAVRIGRRGGRPHQRPAQAAGPGRRRRGPAQLRRRPGPPADGYRSGVPSTGVEASACRRFGIRPASRAAWPASTARRIATAIPAGSSARETELASSTAVASQLHRQGGVRGGADARVAGSPGPRRAR